jgi:hypothetical protein
VERGKAPQRTRTYNPLIKSPPADYRKHGTAEDLRVAAETVAPHWPTEAIHPFPSDADHDLMLIVERWPDRARYDPHRHYRDETLVREGGRS